MKCHHIFVYLMVSVSCVITATLPASQISEVECKKGKAAEERKKIAKLICTDHFLEQMMKREISADQIRNVVLLGKRAEVRDGAISFTERSFPNPLRVIVDPSSYVGITAYYVDTEIGTKKIKVRNGNSFVKRKTGKKRDLLKELNNSKKNERS